MKWFHLSISFTLLIPVWLLLPPDDSSCHNPCFHQPIESCPPPDNTCRCQLLSNCQKAAICCNVNRFTLVEGLACASVTANGIESLHIRNATIESFNLSVSLKDWRHLRYMTITDGNISRIDGEFAKHSRMACLNLSSNHINSIEDRSLVNLFNLSMLDLSVNNLTEVPSVRRESVAVDISNNSNLICLKLKNALVHRPEIVFINENDTFCITTKDFYWFQTSVVLPFAQVKADHELQKHCNHNCTCKAYRLNLSPGKPRTLEVAVNCSGKGFLSLPVPLPANTINLDVSNNNITSIKELSHPSYQNLRSFIADNNKIVSIQPLEGTKFISNFDTLSLQRNQIQTLETYVLDNIQFDFERNYYQRKVNLGFNRLHCDCNTMKLKAWLLSKLSHIPDHNDIKCDNINAKVIELDAAKMCQDPQDWTDFIYYIITIELVLLISLVAKVTYDYWIFKTHGYLPWPANKMPRLPCDWLCE